MIWLAMREEIDKGMDGEGYAEVFDEGPRS
jgi:hypothetical protein